MAVDNLSVPTVRRFVDNRHDLAITGNLRLSSTFFDVSQDRYRLKSHAHAKIVNLVHDPLFEDRLGNSPRKAARQNVTWDEPRSLPPPENSIPPGGVRLPPLHQPTTQG